MQKNRRVGIATVALTILSCVLAGRADERPAKVEPKAKQGSVQSPAPRAKAGKSADVKSAAGDRELKTIMLNQKTNKKEQSVTQLTNILSKSNDTRTAIIKNLK